MIGLLASIKSGINTLTGRLTSGRATALDNLDAAITTRMGSIKTVQRGTISYTGTDGNNTASITSVTTSKSTIRLLGVSSGSSGATVRARIELTNGTTVTAYVTASASSTYVVGYEVIEFN